MLLAAAGSFTDAIQQTTCNRCTQGTSYQPSAGQSGCLLVRSVCPAGSYESTSPSLTENRVCTPCDGVNYFQDLPGQTGCKRAATCTAGFFIHRDTTQISDRICLRCLTQRDCKTGEYLAGTCSGTSATECRPCHGTCETCTGSAENQCATCAANLRLQSGRCVNPCASGTYLNGVTCSPCDSSCATCQGSGASACTGCKPPRVLDVSTRKCVARCISGYFFDENTDECTRCSACAADEFANAACTGTSNTACVKLRNCLPGTFISSQGSDTANRICTNCDGVSGFQDQVNRDSCKPVTVCQAGYRINQAASRSTDRTCTACLAGSAASGQNAGSCTACDRGTFAGAAGATACSNCGAGFFSDQPGATSCKPIPAGSFGTGGTLSTRTGMAACPIGHRCPGGDAQPIECSSSSQFQDQRGMANCKDARDCGLGQQANAQPTISSDRTCVACPANTFQVCADWTGPGLWGRWVGKRSSRGNQVWCFGWLPMAGW